MPKPLTTCAALRVRLAQMDVSPARPRLNTARMLHWIRTARRDGVDLLIFPEMCVPGYLLADEWERDAFLRECEDCTRRLIAASTGIALIFGNIAIDRSRRNEDGRVRKYNALFTAQDGALCGPEGGIYPFVIKTLMPNYRQFDDSRHFFDLRKLALEEHCSPASLIRPVAIRQARLGCMLCEDGWDEDYGLSPATLLADQGAEWLINISASPFTFGKNAKRHRVFSALAHRCHRPLIYVNHVGIQNNGKTIFTFDGGSCVYDGQGGQMALGTPFQPGSLTLTLPRNDAIRLERLETGRGDDIGNVCQALRYGIQSFLAQLGIHRVIVGLSGGIDSAVSATLFSLCVGPDNLLLINMPSRFNSKTTISLARRLAENLGARYAEVPIEAATTLTRQQVSDTRFSVKGTPVSFALSLSDFMFENIQARDRSARILAAFSASFGGVFPCNANKAELTVGYGTLYGDLCGFLAPLGDLWKTEVWELGDYLNQSVFHGECIPAGTLSLTPSAELSASQNVDRGEGDPLRYAWHDRVFSAWVERWNRASPEDVLEWRLAGTLERELGYNGRVENLFESAVAFVSDVERWWNQYQGMAVAKRIQAPPILAVKRRAFGFDHRESQLPPRYSRRYHALKQQVLLQTWHPD